MTVIAVFAMQTTASIALAACACNHNPPEQSQTENPQLKMPMAQTQMVDMPCHNVEKTELHADSLSNTEHAPLDSWETCACNHGALSQAIALPSQISTFLNNDKADSPLHISSYMKSAVSYSIDYPPKTIS